MLHMRTVYVTVGSTRFDELIHKVTTDEVLKILQSKGCKNLILQIGKGVKSDVQNISIKYGMHVEQYDFKIESKRTDIINADLVIGHAGAGTCLDILTNRKAGILVINEKLMNNHQQELALHMKKEGYMECCTVEELKNCIEQLNLNERILYEPGKNIGAFVKFMDDLMVS